MCGRRHLSHNRLHYDYLAAQRNTKSKVIERCLLSHPYLLSEGQEKSNNVFLSVVNILGMLLTEKKTTTRHECLGVFPNVFI